MAAERFAVVIGTCVAEYTIAEAVDTPFDEGTGKQVAGIGPETDIEMGTVALQAGRPVEKAGAWSLERVAGYSGVEHSALWGSVEARSPEEDIFEVALAFS